MSQYFKIGKIVATWHYKGHLVLKHSLGKKTTLKGLEAVFIEDKSDSFFPFFIQETKARKNVDELLLKLEGTDSLEDGKKLLNKDIWVSEIDFKKFAAKTAPISLLGFSMIHEGEAIGDVIEVIEQPHQLLCSILYKGKEALIPIHEETLEKIDMKNRKVFVKLPDGLLDIYL
ncbi:MAG: 16S rRNA processing protein RimM [Ferruginibacter sp.]